MHGKKLMIVASEDIQFYHQLNDATRDAINSLMNNKILGFSVFGPNISRNGHIQLIAFAIDDVIAVFEAKSDVMECLKPLLESEAHQKVLHSCRGVSDALMHLYGIQLLGIIDTRVFDAHLQQYFSCERTNDLSQSNESKPIQLRPLDECIRSYLNIEIPKYMHSSDTIDYLSLKPLSRDTEIIIKSQTVHLRELFRKMQYLLMRNAIVSTNVNLNRLRNADKFDYIAYDTEEEMIKMIQYQPQINDDISESRIIKMCYQRMN